MTKLQNVRGPVSAIVSRAGRFVLPARPRRDQGSTVSLPDHDLSYIFFFSAITKGYTRTRPGSRRDRRRRRPRCDRAGAGCRATCSSTQPRPAPRPYSCHHEGRQAPIGSGGRRGSGRSWQIWIQSRGSRPFQRPQGLQVQALLKPGRHRRRSRSAMCSRSRAVRRTSVSYTPNGLVARHQHGVVLRAGLDAGRRWLQGRPSGRDAFGRWRSRNGAT